MILYLSFLFCPLLAGILCAYSLKATAASYNKAIANGCTVFVYVLVIELLIAVAIWLVQFGLE